MAGRAWPFTRPPHSRHPDCPHPPASAVLCPQGSHSPPMPSREGCLAFGFWLQILCSALVLSAPQESCPPALGVSQEDEVRPRADCTSFSLREIAFSGTLLISDGLAGPGGAPWAAPLQLPPAPRLADGPENCVPYLGADSRCAWAPWHFS